jgi:broad specificity phosphatase PhoE
MSDSLSEKKIGGEYILKILEGIPHHLPVVAFLRHAEREKAKHDNRFHADSSDLRLTPNGHATATNFGRSLQGGRDLYQYHGTTPRAVETAVDIDKGFRETHPTEKSDILGSDRLLSTFHTATVNDEKRRRLKRELGGGRALLRMWMDGGVPLDVMRPAEEAREGLLRMLRDHLGHARPASLGLFITHDFSIILLRDKLFSVRFEDASWPYYLDGIVLTESPDSGLCAYWRDRVVSLTSSG